MMPHVREVRLEGTSVGLIKYLSAYLAMIPFSLNILIHLTYFSDMICFSLDI